MAELAEIVSEFGASAKGKLANPAVTGAPEDQLRAPLETLVRDIAVLAGIRERRASSSARRRWRISRPGPTTPSPSATRSSASSRSRRPARAPIRAGSRIAHDKEQWDKLKSLPNLHLHRRQRLQPVAGRRTRRSDRSSARATSRHPAPSSLPRRRCCRCSLTSSTGSRSPPTQRQATGAGQRRALVPLAARRGGRATGARQPGPHRPRARTGASCCFRKRPTSSSPTATRRR